MINENKSALSALMGTLTPKDITPATRDNEYPVEFIDKRFKQIVRASSLIKIRVFNMDKPESAAEYSAIINAQNVHMIKEDTSFATFEEGDMESKTKDTYYKVALKYSEVDYTKVIAGVSSLIKDSLLSADMGKGIILAAFPDLITRKDEIYAKFEKTEEELLEKKKEETPEGKARRRIKEESLAKQSKDADEILKKYLGKDTSSKGLAGTAVAADLLKVRVKEEDEKITSINKGDTDVPTS